MMRYMLLTITFLLSGCFGPVKVQSIDRYTLEAVNVDEYPRQGGVLLIPMPQVEKGLQTNDMLFSEKAYQINAYSFSKWTSPPANLLHKILLESFNRAGIYKAVISSSYSKSAKWKLEIRILQWHQTFIRYPSRVVVSYVANIYDTKKQKIVASRVFETSIRAKTENAYGGVRAMNYAMDELIPDTIEFVRRNTRH